MKEGPSPSIGMRKREAPGGGGAGRFNSILGSCRAGEGGAPPDGAASLAALYDSIWDGMALCTRGVFLPSDMHFAHIWRGPLLIAAADLFEFGHGEQFGVDLAAVKGIGQHDVGNRALGIDHGPFA
mgnify:CR=1 FL=1